jgi:ADP-ribosylglycohydrolase
MTRPDRIIGCLIGGAIGEAMGSAYEGVSPPIQFDDSLSWNVTDDTQLTLATCAAITAARRVDPTSIAESFAGAFRRGRLSRMGASTYQAIEGLAAGGHWALVGRKGEQAAGNGAAMRTAPLAFCLDLAESADRRILRDVCRITHHNDEAYVGALAVALAVNRASQGLWTGGPGLVSSVADEIPDSRVRDRLREFEIVDSSRALVDVAAQFGNSGYVAESVPFALLAAEHARGADFAEWLRGLVEAGGDTDTIASIAGQIVGCAVGYDRLPKDLVGRLPDPAEMRRVIDAFAVYVMSRSV